MAKNTRPSIRLVAERARVSVATVSNVLNDKPTVSPEIVARVRQTVKELGYVVDISASRLRSGQSRLAAVVVPDLANPMFATFVSTLENAARLDGFDLVVVSARNSAAEEADRLVNLRAWRPAGLIIIPCDGRLLARLPNSGLGPVVVADRIPDDPGFDLIAVDNGPASAAVARAIEAAGHPECLVVGTSLGISNIRERWDGARSGCSRMELELMEVGLNDTARLERLEARLRSPGPAGGAVLARPWHDAHRLPHALRDRPAHPRGHRLRELRRDRLDGTRQPRHHRRAPAGRRDGGMCLDAAQAPHPRRCDHRGAAAPAAPLPHHDAGLDRTARCAPRVAPERRPRPGPTGNPGGEHACKGGTVRQAARRGAPAMGVAGAGVSLPADPVPAAGEPQARVVVKISGALSLDARGEGPQPAAPSARTL